VDELGTILREARETKGLTAAQAQERTRISARFIEAMEEGRYQDLPTPVHVRGFLKNYARFLGLDPQPLLARYELSQNHRPVPVSTNNHHDITPSTPLPSREDKVFFNPVNTTLGEEQGSGSDTIMRWAIIIALIVLLGLVANRFIPMLRGEGDGTTGLTEGLTEAVNNIVNNPPTPTSESGSGEGDPLLMTAAGEVITSTARDVIVGEPLPTVTPTRPPLPGTMETVQLRLEITERTWLQVTVDGQVAYEGLARSGDVFEWEAAESARLVTGNGIGVFVTVNGVALGKLGGRGQVIDESWTTTN
jgi:cytoskeleton protein RodZ